MYDDKLKSNITAAIKKIQDLKHEDIKKNFIVKATVATNKSPGYQLNINSIQ